MLNVQLEESLKWLFKQLIYFIYTHVNEDNTTPIFSKLFFIQNSSKEQNLQEVIFKMRPLKNIHK